MSATFLRNPFFENNKIVHLVLLKILATYVGFNNSVIEICTISSPLPPLQSQCGKLVSFGSWTAELCMCSWNTKHTLQGLKFQTVQDSVEYCNSSSAYEKIVALVLILEHISTMKVLHISTVNKFGCTGQRRVRL